MKQDLFFWNRWLPLYRRLYISLFVLFGISIIIYFIQKVIGANSVISWNTVNEVQDISFDIDSFTKGIFNFTTTAPSFLVVEWFEASDMQINDIATYIYGGSVAIAMIWILSLLPSLSRWWYLGSMMVVIALFTSFQFDILQVWGFSNFTILIVFLIVILPVSYYFHAFRPDISLPIRLLTFTLVILFVAFISIKFAAIHNPSMSILSYGTRILAIISVLFIFITAHEIPSHLLLLITNTGITTSRNSLFHFTVITLFYVGNLIVSYLYNSGLIDWNFLYINGFYLLIVTLILGIWGFRKRVGSWLSDPYSTMLYAALGIITISSIGYAIATGNDPMMDMYEDTIIYSHLAMGIAFYMYVLINFRGPMTQGLPVHKIMYQPRIMPFGLSFALAALIMLALLFRVSMLPFNQGVAGYHNYLGDLYFAEKSYVLSESYYKKALLFQQRNHKSNYALATIAKQHNNPEVMAAFLKQAITNKPTPYTYAALSQLYSQEELFFEALFTLKEGTQKFPNSGELFNNLAILYEKTHVLDSAYYYYNQALDLTNKSEEVQTNLVAFWAKNLSTQKIDSVFGTIQPSSYYALESNRLVMSNILHKQDKQAYLPIPDTLLTRERFTYLYNYVLNHKTDKDTVPAHQLKLITTKPDNSLFTSYLDFAQAVQLYYTQNIAKGVDILKNTEQGTSGQQSAHLNKILGTWYLQQNAPALAVYRFEKAVKAGDTLSLVNQGFALTETGDFGRADSLWQALRMSPIPQFRGVSNTMAKVTHTLSGYKTDSLSDAEKVALVYFSHKEDLTPVVSSINDLSFRASALLYLAENHLNANNTSAAESDLQALQSLSVTDSSAKELISELQLKTVWLKKDWNTLAKLINSSHSTRKTFYQAEIAASEGKKAEAEKYYLQAMKELPFDESIVLAAEEFYNRQNNPDRGYEILTTALQTNPMAPEIQKAYVLQSLELNLTDYAAQGMEELKRILPPADYQSFAPKYEEKRALIEKKLAEWK
ncbi:hypothetical protein QNI19_22270 [Cytophagaceae bacterium DM2B3-1]|uniref:Tetratricopeptide repeat protein n=1 Tax=Xanthocytophaga flava TaxID=3048013 RepID=A0ABT7CPK4_9BACT|nr:hypothetical protein [Xanthocytophaga flavus]MDJ1495678.1 hypothetical protein [Xanthocytophaga flavus]